MYCDDLITDMGADANYIKWMEAGTRTWYTHLSGDGPGGPNNVPLFVGNAYEVEFTATTFVTFVGMPGSMILYRSSSYGGFEPATTAQSLSAVVVGNSVQLSWDRPSGILDNDFYGVYFSISRDGFSGVLNVDFWEVPGGPVLVSGPGGSVTHTDALLTYDELYYIVIPYNATLNGASTYSIGVVVDYYFAGYDTMALPLELEAGDNTVDWYCDNIQNTRGINYVLYSEQRWVWHRINMPGGIFDTTVILSEGYQISTTASTKFVFIGR
jgi:hypothetical protein